MHERQATTKRRHPARSQIVVGIRGWKDDVDGALASTPELLLGQLYLRIVSFAGVCESTASV